MDYSPPGSSAMGFPRQEYWSGLPFFSPGHLHNPGVEPASLALAGGLFGTEPPGKPSMYVIYSFFFFCMSAIILKYLKYIHIKEQLTYLFHFGYKLLIV